MSRGARSLSRRATAGHGSRLVIGVAADSELFHAVSQSARLETKPDGSAVAALDDPIRFSQRAPNVLALDGVEVVRS